jgi:PKD repeat protein
MAYDATDGYVVFFGGDNGVSVLAQTWIFSEGRWINATGDQSNAPPAESWPAMDFDAVYGVVLLYGGCSVAACPNNYTWYYSSEYGWTNLTSVLFSAPPSLFAASLTFAADPADEISVLEGGCLDRSCTNASNATYAFAGSGWVEIPNSTNPPPGYDEAVAFDPALGELVLFGGCTLGACPDDRTWTFFNFTWTDRTDALASAGPTPPARSDAVLTWDELDGALLLFGGQGRTHLLADTWDLVCAAGTCAWRNVTSTRESPPALADALAPSVSNGSAGTMLYGGELTVGGPERFSNGTYVYEPDLTIAPTVGPSAPARSSVNAEANPSGGSGSYRSLAGQYSAIWQAGATQSNGINTTFNFSEPGNYSIEVTVIDRFGVSASAQLSYVATGPMSTILGGTSTYVGTPLALSASPALDGHAPYAYRWTFGDGATADGPSVNHTWTAPGDFLTTLFVVDASGVVFTTSETVSVVLAPSVNITVSHRVADAGEEVGFFPLVEGIGGAISYAWNFADGSAVSADASPVHAFAHPGSYNVTLRVFNDSVASVLAWTIVTVYLSVGGTISASAAETTVGAEEAFAAAPTGGVPPYEIGWAFGDGASGAGPAVDHRYATPGERTVRVWINDSVGGSFNGSISVVIGPNPAATAPAASATYWAALAGALFLVALVAGAAVLVRLRRRPPADGRPAARVHP